MLALTMSASLMTPPALAAGVIGEEPFSEFEEQIDETLATLSLRHRASLMQGGIEGEMGQDGWYHHQTKAIEHMGIPFLNMGNGPMGIANTPATSSVGGNHTSFGSGLILAATWNEDLVEEAGVVMGEECLAKDVALFEAPAFNINGISPVVVPLSTIPRTPISPHAPPYPMSREFSPRMWPPISSILWPITRSATVTTTAPM